jgi:hypothetical protein
MTYARCWGSRFWCRDRSRGPSSAAALLRCHQFEYSPQRYECFSIASLRQGDITDHSKFVRSKHAVLISSRKNRSRFEPFGNAVFWNLWRKAERGGGQDTLPEGMKPRGRIRLIPAREEITAAMADNLSNLSDKRALVSGANSETGCRLAECLTRAREEGAIGGRRKDAKGRSGDCDAGGSMNLCGGGKIFRSMPMLAHYSAAKGALAKIAKRLQPHEHQGRARALR